MNVRCFVLLLLPVLPGLAGCQSPQPNMAVARLPTCHSAGNSDDCRIPVHVIRRPGGCKLAIAKGHQVIRFANEPGNRGRTIHWQLTGNSNYQFPANGFQFKGPTGAAFTDFMRSDENRDFHLTNQNPESETLDMTYKYDVQVERVGDPTDFCKLDPFIRNVRS